MLKKYIFKLCYFIKLFYLTSFNKVKLSLVWSVGKGLKTEGKIYIPAVKGNVNLGDNVWLGPDVRMGATNNSILNIGNDVSINQGTFIISRENINIGDSCRIGEYVSIRDYDHEWKDPSIPIKDQGYKTKPILIQKDVWIGRGASILKGVTIGEGAIIGCNAVVTKNIDKFSVVAGVPARKISERVGGI